MEGQSSLEAGRSCIDNINTCWSDLQDGFWIGWLDLLHVMYEYSQLGTTGNTALSLIYTHRYTRTRILSFH
jgi:hypothetical protein